MEPKFSTEPESAIKNAYNRTDGKILAKAADLGPGGSTAVTAILVNGKKLFVANTGDSRAGICKNGIAIELTVDHEPSIELQNIKKVGFVTLLPGDVPRVHLSSEPDVRDTTIDATTKFLILASDGLWKRGSFLKFLKKDAPSNCITKRGFPFPRCQIRGAFICPVPGIACSVTP